MMFDAFLRDSHRRPFKLRMLGYGVSLGLHGPPVTLFMFAWLSRALLMDSSLELSERDVQHVVFYRVPITLSPTFLGLAPAGFGSPASGGDGTLERHGTTGPSRRRTRRPLLSPQLRRTHGPEVEAVPIGPDELVDEGPSGGGNGGGVEGDGPGGPGVLAMGPGGVGRAQAVEARKPRARSHPREESETEDDQSFAVDSEEVAGEPLKGRPLRISMDHAAYLRTYENFPSPLPEASWPPGRTSNSLFVEVCVTEQGGVSDVIIRQSAGPEADAMVTDAIRSWRYRPHLVKGTPTPFCHPIRIVYKRELRFDRRW